MKIVNIQKIAKELNLPYDVVSKELIEVSKQLEREKKGKHYFFDDYRKNVLIIDDVDVQFIKDGFGKRTFADLTINFHLDYEILSWVLNKLYEKKIIGDELLRYYTEVKDRPSVKAWFVPSEVIVGDEADLKIEINSLTEIQNLKISVAKSDSIELTEPLEPPFKIPIGSTILTYTYKAIKYGRHKVDIQLEGLAKGFQPVFEKITSAELMVKPHLPEIRVDVRSKKIPAIYGRECYVNFAIFNKGKGDAQNVETKGLENYPEFSLLGETLLGKISAYAKFEFPLILKPNKSGVFRFDKLFVLYEDLEGNRFKCPIPEFEINVTTLKPRIKVDLLAPSTVRPNQKFSLKAIISNIGDGNARNVDFELPIDLKFIIEGSKGKINLNAGEKLELPFILKAPEQGKISIDNFNVEFEDVEGNRLTQSCEGITITVLETEKPVKKELVQWPFDQKVIGDYEILDEIGEGTFAKVFLARDRRSLLKESVALKALKPEFINDSRIVNDFINEAKIAINLSYEHIVKVRDAKKEEFLGKEYPYIIMEYMKGGSLKDKILPGRAEVFSDCIHIIHDICLALQYAHRQGIVHFDVSPSNIFFDEEKNCWKLGDFGLAKILFKEEFISRHGTLTYTPPEVKKGRGSYESDIYSLGIVFRELLTGDPKGDLSNLEKVHREVSLELLNKVAILIDEMTNVDPAKRPNLDHVLKVVKSLMLRTPRTGLV